MAPELLSSTDYQPPADIFSLALTLFETCLVPGLSALPREGKQWRDLREGNPPEIVNRQVSLCNLIYLSMNPDPNRRPTVDHILNINEVINSPKTDSIIMSAKQICPKKTSLTRSASFRPIFGNILIPSSSSSTDEIERLQTPTNEGNSYFFGYQYQTSSSSSNPEPIDQSESCISTISTPIEN